MSVRHSQNEASIVSLDVTLNGIAAKIYVTSETGAFVTAARLHIDARLLRHWLRQIEYEQDRHCQDPLPW